MNQAIAAAIADEMRADPAVVTWGEDLAEFGGVFHASTGLLDEFGPIRVRDTPISEMGFLGAGVGAAATGLRPVVEIMMIEFLGVALDQLANQAAKFHYLSQGRYRMPLTLRISAGAGYHFGSQHSQMLESWVTATPGVKLALPSNAESAYHLTRAAIRDDGPVVLLEHHALYGDRQEFDIGAPSRYRIGSAVVEREGSGVTLVGLAQTAKFLRQALPDLLDHDPEIIDLSTLAPWDRETVIASVSKTGRLVIVEESPYSAGWGTQVASEVSAACFGDLRSPVLRITTPDAPVPYSFDLEDRWLPKPAYIVEQVDEYMRTSKLPAPWWTEDEVLAS